MEVGLTFILYSSIALGSTALFALASKEKNKYQKWLFVILAISIPSLLAALRGPSVGNDTGMYIPEYYSPGSFVFGSGFRRTFELGYRLLRNAIYFIGMPHQVFFFAMQALTLSFLYAAAKCEADENDICVTMFVYMFDAYFQSFNMMRQALAVAIVIYAYTQIVREKNIKGLLFIILAGFFHRSAWIFVLIILVKYVFKSKHAKLYISVGVALIIVLLTNNNLLRKIAMFFLGDKAIWYTTTSNTGSRLWVYLLKISPIVLLLVLCIKNYYRNNKRVVIYSGLALCGYVLASYGNFVATDAQRIALYLSRLDAIVLGYAVSRHLYISKKSYFHPKHIKTMIYLYWIVMYIYNYFYIGVSDIVPYSIY